MIAWAHWAKQRAMRGNPQQFGARNLYILPSRFGWVFALVLLTLFICAINYQVSAVFFLTFLLAMAAMMSAWEAHFNLRGLTVHCVSIQDAYQNETIQIVLSLELAKTPRYALNYYFNPSEVYKLEKITPDGTQITLSFPVNKRGRFTLPRMTFSSDFPLGLFRVWGYVYLDAPYYVYPMSVSPGFWPRPPLETGNTTAEMPGNEEIYDLKSVLNPWGQLNRIAWKIAARGQGWYLKNMVNPEGNFWLFRIEDLPPNYIEENLQHLCWWLQTAEEKGYFYGLELKGVRTELSQGPIHLTHCLRQLATY